MTQVLSCTKEGNVQPQSPGHPAPTASGHPRSSCTCPRPPHTSPGHPTSSTGHPTRPPGHLTHPPGHLTRPPGLLTCPPVSSRVRISHLLTLVPVSSHVCPSPHMRPRCPQTCPGSLTCPRLLTLSPSSHMSPSPHRRPGCPQTGPGPLAIHSSVVLRILPACLVQPSVWWGVGFPRWSLTCCSERQLGRLHMGRKRSGAVGTA